MTDCPTMLDFLTFGLSCFALGTALTVLLLSLWVR